MNDKNFKPFISANKILPELTPTAIIIGILAAVIFGAANAYLGLRVGMTVSASIPAAVTSMGIIRILLKRSSILENNIVQTIGSAGESVAAGAIFTIPAMFIWQAEWGNLPPSPVKIFLVSICGSLLGVLFMVPLRKALIVKEHGILPYPEGTACAEVLMAGEEKGQKASLVFKGLGISAIYKFIADGIKLFPSELHYEIHKFKGSAIGADILPALVGVGYICGRRISSYILAGGVLGWLVIMPLMSLFGGSYVLFPAEVPISELDSFGIWSQYIRYVGAGAVAMGGIISLIKTTPLIIRTFKDTFKDYSSSKSSASNIRTENELPFNLILFLIIVTIILIWLLPDIPVNLFGAFIIAIFGFFFATVSSRLVGLVGSSNNPVSGMAIATLLIASILLKATGQKGQAGMLSAIAIGSIICIIGAIAGDTSQDLKTGYLLGATPKKQQIGEIIGVTAVSLAMGGILYLLNAAWGYGSPELPAPQATLMKLVVEGVMNNNLPWTLVIAGAGIAVCIELLQIPVLPFSVGLYLPIHLSVPIMIGGIIKSIISGKNKNNASDNGVLYTSGLIAGEGIVGIIIAILAIIPFKEGSIASLIDLSSSFSLGQIGSLIFFAILLASLFYYASPIKQKEKK